MNSIRTDPHLYLYYFLFLALSIFPILYFEFPALVDYPNHLARAHVILNQDHPILSQFYGIDWIFVPNLVFDLFMAAFGPLLGTQISGKLFLVLTIALTTSSSLFLSKALTGRVNVLSFLGFLFIHNFAFYMGFLNFVFSGGLAVLGFAVHLFLLGRTMYIQAVIGAIISFLLLFSHLYGLGVYGLLVLVYGLLTIRPFSILKLASRGVQFILPIAAFLAFSTTSDEVGSLRFAGIEEKVASATLFTMYYDGVGRIVILILSGVFFLAAYVYRKLIFFNGMWVIFFVFACLFLIFPKHIMSGTNADWRLLVPLAFITCGILADPGLKPRLEKMVLVGILVLVAIQTAFVHERWRQANAHQAHINKMLDRLPPGSAIFPAFFSGGWIKAQKPIPWTHMPTMGVMRNSHFLPSLFAFRTQQPLIYKGDYENMRYDTGQVVYEDFDQVPWNKVKANYDYMIVMDHQESAIGWREKIPFETEVVDDGNKSVVLLSVAKGG